MAGNNKTTNDRLTELEITMNKVVVPALDKVVQFVDENKSGIRTASLLDNKIVTAFIGAIIAAGALMLAKGGF